MMLGIGMKKVENFFPFRPILPFRQQSQLKHAYSFCPPKLLSEEVKFILSFL
jgi:hypothetical protein